MATFQGALYQVHITITITITITRNIWHVLWCETVLFFSGMTNKVFGVMFVSFSCVLLWNRTSLMTTSISASDFIILWDHNDRGYWFHEMYW